MDNNNFNNRFPKTDGSGNGREAQSLPSNSSRDAIEGGGTDNEFPGYPHYPASEDIMNPANQVQRVAVDVENLAPTGSVGKKPDNANPSGSFTSAQNVTDDELKIVPGTDADVTREDLRVLSEAEGPYAQTSGSNTVTGEDLDVPGADQDDPNEEIGEEDEENNYYSLGGDNHENLEEDPSV
jgi:hypothetical protein